MDNENMEDVTPTNDEVEEPKTEEPDELTKAKSYGENQKVRAEKAEAENKKLKADLAKKKEEKPKEESDEPNYSQIAFLEGRGVKNPDDQKIVQDEAKRLKLPLTDILGMEHIKSKLKNAQAQREAEDGMPDGTGSGNKGAKNSVDYWVNKTDKDGNYMTPDDQDLAVKVINARMAGIKKKKMFADDKF